MREALAGVMGSGLAQSMKTRRYKAPDWFIVARKDLRSAADDFLKRFNVDYQWLLNQENGGSAVMEYIKSVGATKDDVEDFCLLVSYISHTSDYLWAKLRWIERDRFGRAMHLQIDIEKGEITVPSVASDVVQNIKEMLQRDNEASKSNN